MVFLNSVAKYRRLLSPFGIVRLVLMVAIACRLMMPDCGHEDHLKAPIGEKPCTVHAPVREHPSIAGIETDATGLRSII